MTSFLWATLFLTAGLFGYDEDARPVSAEDKSSPVEDAKPQDVVNMPDITGKWTMRSWRIDSPQQNETVIIRRSAKTPKELELVPNQDQPAQGEKEFVIPIAWTAGTRRFTTKYANEFTSQNYSFQVGAGNQSLRVTIEIDDKTRKHFIERGLSEAQIDERLNQVWTRDAGPVPKIIAESPNHESQAEEKKSAAMPDITGQWLTAARPPTHHTVSLLHRISWNDKKQPMVSLQFQDGLDDIITQRMELQWQADKRQFAGQLPFPLGGKEQGAASYTLQLTDQPGELLVDIVWDDKAKKIIGEPSAKIDGETFGEFHQRWVRVDPKKQSAQAKPQIIESLNGLVSQIPNISGMWTGSFGPRQSKIKITAVEAGKDFHFLMTSTTEPELQLTWLPEQLVFEAKMADHSPAHWYLFRSNKNKSHISVFEIADDPHREELLTVLSNPDLGRTPYTQLHKLRILDRIQGTDYLLIETKGGFSAYSDVTGTWDYVKLAQPKDGFPRLTEITASKHFATAAIDDFLVGYSSQAGRWGKINIPPEHIGKVTVTHENVVTATIGDQFYALSPRTGQWMVAGGPDDASVATSSETPALTTRTVPIKHRKNIDDMIRKLTRYYKRTATFGIDSRAHAIVVSGSDPSQVAEIEQAIKNYDERLGTTKPSAIAEESRETFPPSQPPTSLAVKRLVDEIARHEAEAVELAEQIRIRSMDLGNDHPELARDSKKIEYIVAAAQALRLQLEFLRNEKSENKTPFTTLDTSTIKAAVPPLDTPAARRLADEIARREAEAAKQGEEFRHQFGTLGREHPDLRKAHQNANLQSCLVCHDEGSHQKFLQSRERLTQTLAAALDLKFQLEQLQVEALQTRLSRLEQQIGQRKALRQKIIDRRVEELIEGDATQWTSDSEPQVKTETPSRTKAAAEPQRSLLPTADSPRGFGSILWQSEPIPTDRRIEFSGPQGVTIDFVHFHQWGKPLEFSGLPSKFTFGRELGPYRLRFASPPKNSSDPTPVYYGTLEFSPIKSHTEFFWKEHEIPVTITESDIEQVSAGNFVTKVVYLSEAGIRNPAKAKAETLVSTKLDSSIDPILEADRRGAVLAVLRLANDSEKLGKLTGEASAAAPTDAMKFKSARAHTNQITIDLYAGDGIYKRNNQQRGKLIDDVVQALNQLRDVTVNIKIAGDGDAFVMAVVHDPAQRTANDPKLRDSIRDVLKTAGVPGVRWEGVGHEAPTRSTEENRTRATLRDEDLQPGPTASETPYLHFAAKLDEARERVESAQRSLEIKQKNNLDGIDEDKKQLERAQQHQKHAQAEYNALQRDLELQVESAKLSLEEAAAKLDRANRLFAQKVLTQQEKTEVEYESKRARLALERLQNRLDFYRQAGEGMMPERDTELSTPPGEANKPDAEPDATAKRIWESLGLKLSALKLNEMNQVNSKYRGGLRVTDIAPDSALASHGMRQGDILVGLGKWETTSLQNVDWILKRFPDAPVLKFYLMRGGEVVYGTIPSPLPKGQAY